MRYYLQTGNKPSTRRVHGLYKLYEPYKLLAELNEHFGWKIKKSYRKLVLSDSFN